MWQKKPITEARYDRRAENLRKHVQRVSASSGLSKELIERIRREVFYPELLSYQIKWCEDKSPFKVIEKSRQIGLTWSDAGDSVLQAAKKGGKNIWYAAQSKDVALQYIQDALFWADKFAVSAKDEGEVLIEDEKGDIASFRIRFSSKNTITALSSAPSAWRSKRGIAKLDEAGHQKDFDETLKAAKALRIWGGDGAVSVIGTHNGYGSKFNELILDIRSGKFPYSLHRVTFADAVDVGLCRKIFEKEGTDWTPEKQDAWVSMIRAEYGHDAAEELDVIPAQGGTTPFPRALVEQCMSRELPVLRLEKSNLFEMLDIALRQQEVEEWINDNLMPVLSGMDQARRTYLGMDFGRSGDLSVIWLLQEAGPVPVDFKKINYLRNIDFYSPAIIEMSNIPHEQQRQVLWSIMDHVPRLGHAALDARGNGSYLAEVTAQRYGSAVSRVHFTEGWYRDNMPVYQAAYQDRQLLIPYSIDIIDDHREMKIVDGVMRLPKKTDQKGRHGDSAIAGALAWYASRQPGGGPIEYHRVESLRSSGRGWQRGR